MTQTLGVLPLQTRPNAVQSADREGPSLNERVGFAAKDLMWQRAFKTSKVLKAALLTTSVAVLCGCLAFNPFGLAAVGLATLLTIVGFVFLASATLILRDKKMGFEAAAIWRMWGFKGPNFHEIKIEGRDETLGKIYLGALPNQLQGEGEKLLNEQNIQAVLSINEEWEVEPMGFSVPCNKQYWENNGLEAFKRLNLRDHVPLKTQQMDEAAEFIREQTEQGRNVYVHCRAGRGRSAMGIAGYLMKYGPNGKGENRMNISQTIRVIKEQREIATIEEKIHALVAYQHHLCLN
jgi:protein-tyrosine phosphatase